MCSNSEEIVIKQEQDVVQVKVEDDPKLEMENEQELNDFEFDPRQFSTCKVNDNGIKNEENETKSNFLSSLNYVEIKNEDRLDLSFVDESDQYESTLTDVTSTCTNTQASHSDLNVDKEFDPLLWQGDVFPDSLRSILVKIDSGQGQDCQDQDNSNMTSDPSPSPCPSQQNEILYFTCDLCNANFSDTFLLFHHKTKIHPTITQNRTDLDHIYSIYRGRWIYEKITFGVLRKEVIYRCSTCGKEMKTRKSVTQHIWIFHCDRTRAFLCEKCNSTFTDSNLLQAHNCPQTHFLSRQVLINHCGNGIFRFRGEWEYEYKLIDVMGLKIPCFTCSTCGVQIKTQRNMCSHIENYHCQGSLICDRCNRSFETETLLKDHRCAIRNTALSSWSKWVDLGNGKFQCDDKWSCHLDGHQFVCDHCGTKRKVKEKMKGHFRTVHSDEITFECSVCGKGFSVRKNYDNHLKIHLKTPQHEKTKWQKYTQF